MVPVGLAGLAITTPLSGVRRWAAISAFADNAQRVSADVSISTGSQPSAERMWRYGGHPRVGSGPPAPGSEKKRKNNEKKPREHALPTHPPGTWREPEHALCL